MGSPTTTLYTYPAKGPPSIKLLLGLIKANEGENLGGVVTGGGAVEEPITRAGLAESGFRACACCLRTSRSETKLLVRTQFEQRQSQQSESRTD